MVEGRWRLHLNELHYTKHRPQTDERSSCCLFTAEESKYLHELSDIIKAIMSAEPERFGSPVELGSGPALPVLSNIIIIKESERTESHFCLI